MWGPYALLFSRYGCYFPGVKRARLDVGHSHVSSAKVKKSVTILLLPVDDFMR